VIVKICGISKQTPVKSLDNAGLTFLGFYAKVPVYAC